MTRSLVLCLTLAAGAPALAERSQPGELLSPEELRAEIFGVHLYGYEENAGFLWDECIEPNGGTVYRTGSENDASRYSELGQLEIRSSGQACFSYPPRTDPLPTCFDVMRTEDGYAFILDGGRANFITTRIERHVQVCPDPLSLVS